MSRSGKTERECEESMVIKNAKESTYTAIKAEVFRARRKHDTCYLAALMEEVGEVAEAMMQEGSMSERAREELVQVAATTIRLIEEGDHLLIEPVGDTGEL